HVAQVVQSKKERVVGYFALFTAGFDPEKIFAATADVGCVGENAAASARGGAHRDPVIHLVANKGLDVIVEVGDEHLASLGARGDRAARLVDHFENGEVCIDMRSAPLRAAGGQHHAFAHGIFVAHVRAEHLLEPGG